MTNSSKFITVLTSIVVAAKSARVNVSRMFFEQTLAQHPRGFDELRIVQEHERLQRRGGGFPPGGATLAGDCVERQHGWRRRGATPKRVEAAAIELVAMILRVGLARAGLFPQSRGLIRLDARPADRAIQQPAGGERAVANLLRLQTMLRPAREQEV